MGNALQVENQKNHHYNHLVVHHLYCKPHLHFLQHPQVLYFKLQNLQYCSLLQLSLLYFQRFQDFPAIIIHFLTIQSQHHQLSFRGLRTQKTWK